MSAWARAAAAAARRASWNGGWLGGWRGHLRGMEITAKILTCRLHWKGLQFRKKERRIKGRQLTIIFLPPTTYEPQPTIYCVQLILRKNFHLLTTLANTESRCVYICPLSAVQYFMLSIYLLCLAGHSFSPCSVLNALLPTASVTYDCA